MKNRFGRALRELRQALALSQLELAHAVGTTQRHVSFLETGRSAPTREMIGRLATSLSLSVAQRQALFLASGFASPFPRRSMDSADVQATLELLDRRLIRHWPFPAYVMDRQWRVLRANRPGHQLLEGFALDGIAEVSLLDLFMAELFRERVVNWQELSMAFFFRMQAAAVESAAFASRFEHARSQGLFDHVPAYLTGGQEVPALVPAILQAPDGSRMVLTSLVGHLATAHDALVDGLEVELMVPVDDATEARMLAAWSGTS